MKSGVRQPPTRAFMDDMTVTAKSVVEGRWMLEDLEKLISWARMRFKPAKSRSLVLQKGKVQERSRFKVGGQVIPTMSWCCSLDSASLTAFRASHFLPVLTSIPASRIFGSLLLLSVITALAFVVL